MVFPIHFNFLLITSASVLNPEPAMVLVIVLSNSVTLSEHPSPHRGKRLLLLFNLSFLYQTKDFSQWSNDRQRDTLMSKPFSPVCDFSGFAAQPLSPHQLQGFGYWGNHSDMNTEITLSLIRCAPIHTILGRNKEFS